MAENENKVDYAALLADLEAKRNVLDTAISSLRAAIAAGAVGQPGEGSLSFSVPSVSGSIHGGEVPAGAFLGKSLPEAAKLYLSIVKKKQTTREIADALLKGGMETTSTKFENIVHAGLNRAKKAVGDLVRVGNAWALAEWYPKGIRTAAAQEKRKNRKSKPKRLKAATTAPPTQVESPKLAIAGNGHHPTKLSERAVDFIKSHPDEEFTAKQLSERFGIHSKVISMTLARPVKEGLIRMSAPATYTAAKFSA